MSHLTEDTNGASDPRVLYLFARYRHFAVLTEDEGAESDRPQDLETTFNEIACQISLLQDYETELANQYGMTGVVDSVAVFQETKSRALLRKDKDCIFALLAVNMLYRLRLESSTIQRRLPACKVKAPLHNGRPSHPSKRIGASHFWAVIIGIDAYQNSELHGCVSDALSMKDYLCNILGVPRDHLQLLLGQKGHNARDNNAIPSRQNIISTLLGLITNPDIMQGDNIIIYFSGHGSSYLWKDYYPNDFQNSENKLDLFATGSVEALCPIDRNEHEDTGYSIPDISDREINIILSELAHAKGNHITLILDCCYSSSASRCISQPGIRNLHPLPRGSFKDMLLAADDNLGQFVGHRSVFSEDWLPDTASHVVLAACKEYEFAKEMPGDTGFNGFFTKSLIRTLTAGHLTEEATYADLVAALDRSYHQTPVAAGKHTGSKLWFQN